MSHHTLASTRLLQDSVVMDWMIKRLNGSFVAKDFLPTTTSANDTFKWFYKGTVGGMTPEVGENDPGQLFHTEHEQRTARTKYYRERVGISLYAQNTINITDLAQDNINDLTDRMALRLESLRISAISGAVNMTITGDYATDSDNYFYWGSESVDGSYRMTVSGGNLIIQKRIATVWTTLQEFGE